MPGPTIPARFTPAVSALRTLQEEPRYLGAFLFGSVAEGRSDDHSDLDAIVQVGDDNPCPNVNHPGFWGHKLDLTFRSLRQIEQWTEAVVGAGQREPGIERGLILFDKTGELAALQRRFFTVRREPVTDHVRQDAAALVYHIDQKVRRHLDEDPDAALNCMHVGVGELLDQHFRLQGRWWVSSKRTLGELDAWDRPLAERVRRFLAAADPGAKFAAWTAVVDHVLAPLGGRHPISENNCSCPVCVADLRALQDSGTGSSARSFA